MADAVILSRDVEPDRQQKAANVHGNRLAWGLRLDRHLAAKLPNAARAFIPDGDIQKIGKLLGLGHGVMASLRFDDVDAGSGFQDEVHFQSPLDVVLAKNLDGADLVDLASTEVAWLGNVGIIFGRLRKSTVTSNREPSPPVKVLATQFCGDLPEQHVQRDEAAMGSQKESHAAKQ